jgi:hypothetical protein
MHSLRRGLACEARKVVAADEPCAFAGAEDQRGCGSQAWPTEHVFASLLSTGLDGPIADRGPGTALPDLLPTAVLYLCREIHRRRPSVHW